MRETLTDPSGETDRNVRRSDWPRVRFLPFKVRLLVYAFWLGILLVVASLLRTNSRQLTLLAHEGQTTTATITARHVSPTDTHDYYVDYHFEARGRGCTGTAAVSQEVYNRSHQGDPFTITYLPANPAIIQQGRVNQAQAAEARRSAALWLGILTLCFAVVAGCMERYFRR